MKTRTIFVVLICALMASCTAQPANPPQPPVVITQIVVVPPDTATTTTAPNLPATPLPLPSATPLPSLTPLPTLTPTNPASATPTVPTATLIKNANCRKGPSQAYEVVTSFLKGQVLEIVGRNDDLSNTWWQVKIPGSKKSKCWISLTTAQATGNMDDIPTIYPPY